MKISVSVTKERQIRCNAVKFMVAFEKHDLKADDAFRSVLADVNYFKTMLVDSGIDISAINTSPITIEACRIGDTLIKNQPTYASRATVSTTLPVRWQNANHRFGSIYNMFTKLATGYKFKYKYVPEDLMLDKIALRSALLVEAKEIAKQLLSEISPENLVLVQADYCNSSETDIKIQSESVFQRVDDHFTDYLNEIISLENAPMVTLSDTITSVWKTKKTRRKHNE